MTWVITRRALLATAILAGVACGRGDNPDSGLVGTVAAPPTCVEDVRSGDCIGSGDRIVLTFTSETGSHHAVETRIGRQYKVALAPGRYQVSTDRDGIGVATPREVVVASGAVTRVDLLWPAAAAGSA